jgi:DNA-binding LytR/AlgR family response regulator
MGSAIKILIVEDEMIIGAKISMQLISLGYVVTGILPRGEEALQHVRDNKPDLLLLDIQLKGSMDGIETARQLQKEGPLPIIYITANSDEASFERAKATKPHAFITKPFKQLDLQRAIELAISRMAENSTGLVAENSPEEGQSFILSDRIFVRHKEKMMKIMLADILFMEAERNYSRIFTSNKEFFLSVTLKIIEEKLTASQLFLRIHRSYLINISQVDEVAENQVLVGKREIPLGTGMRELLMQRLQTL